MQHFVWPGITLLWQAQCFRQMEWKNRTTHWYEAVSSALNFLFLKEVSQNCFVFDVVNFEKWGCLADLFRFWCSKNEEVSQNCFVFKLTDRQTGRQAGREADIQTDRYTTTTAATTTLHYHHSYTCKNPCIITLQYTNYTTIRQYANYITLR